MAGKLEDRIERVRSLRKESAEAAEPLLRKALADRSNLIIAEAAKVSAEHRCIRLIPDLLTAFDRLFADPVKNDSKCWGKTAILKALAAMDYSESAPYLRGMRHIQMEPVWGGQEDAAIHLRANATLALVQCADLSRPEVLRHLVDALIDPADPVRIEAVRALEQMDGEEPALVLRLKAHTGDRRPHVLGQVFDALLHMEGARGIAFVCGFLHSSNDEVRDEAALSLGASRSAAAVTILIKAWDAAGNRQFRSVLLRALSSSREEAAFEFLLDLVTKGATRDFTDAVDALELHKDSPEIRERVERARRDRALEDPETD